MTMPGNGQTLRRPPMADVTATILECAGRSGRLWWTEWGGLQWSPTRLADGRPFHGADRLVLAAAALSSNYADRRWGTMSQLDALDYRIRKIDRAQGIVIGDECLYNAELGRRKRGTGARHDSPIPAEEHVRDARAREVLRAASAIVPPHMARQGAAGLAQFLRVMALACMPKGFACASNSDDATALRPLVADMACAMALSDLGIAPSHARTREPIPCDSPAEPWTGIVRESPDVLAGCAILAETTVSVAFSMTLIEARRRRGRTASDSGANQQAAETAKRVTSSQHVERKASPIATNKPRLIDELHTATPMAQPVQTRVDGAQSQGFASPGYTLHDEAEASRLASKALSGMHANN